MHEYEVKVEIQHFADGLQVAEEERTGNLPPSWAGTERNKRGLLVSAEHPAGDAGPCAEAAEEADGGLGTEDFVFALNQEGNNVSTEEWVLMGLRKWK